MSHIRDWNSDRVIGIEEIKEHLYIFLDKETTSSPEEINVILGNIKSCVLYGSSQKVIKYEDGILWWKRENNYKFNDIDIAIIMSSNYKFKHKNMFIAPNGDITLEDSQGYHIVDLAKREIHYLILTEKKYKEGLKKKAEHCIGIQNGKRLYVK